jgi:hypothetical protein
MIFFRLSEIDLMQILQYWGISLEYWWGILEDIELKERMKNYD